jgi:nondiscriminating glutamyl-tRNA synthetase
MTVRVRFAPSPSGDLHVGNARTALFNWLFAKKEGGQLVFRVEDTDSDRSDDASIASIADSLNWLGLKADEGHGIGGPYEPYRQSQRTATYLEASEKLIADGRAYWCYDTEAELEEERQYALHHPEARKKRHPHRDAAPADLERFHAEGRKPSLRFATDDLSGEIAWKDAVRGDVSFHLDEIRDFALMKSDGTPMYNFACICDDHAMQISHVIRGEDGISNTPRQLLMYKAFGWTPPVFAHVSFILGPDGQKLSKRHGDTGITSFKNKGYLPEALLNYLGLLGMGGEGEGEEIFDLAQLTERFHMERLIKKSSVFDYGKLDFLNSHYLKAKTGAELRVLAAPFLQGVDMDPTWIEHALEVLKGNARHLGELRPLVDELLAPAGPTAHAVGLAKAFADPAAVVRAALAALASWPSDADFPAKLKEAQKASGVKGKDFFMPLRLATTGHEHGAELPRLLSLMGPERALDRLNAFLIALGA